MPRVGIRHVQVGAAARARSRKPSGTWRGLPGAGSAVRFVIGEYGSGKTFYLTLARTVAAEKKLVVMHADLSPERRLHATGGQARTLCADLIQSMATRTKPEGGALPSIVERFLGDTQKQAAKDGRDPGDAIRDRLEAVRDGVAGYDFSEVVVRYRDAIENGDEALKAAALRWLRAEYTLKTEARQALGVRTIVEDSGVYDHLKAMSRLVQLAGYDGTLIVPGRDGEPLQVGELASPATRTTSKSLRIVNDALQGFRGTSRLLLRGNSRLPPGHAPRPVFLRSAAFTAGGEFLLPRDGLVDLSGPVIRLQSLSPDEMQVLLERLRLLWASGDPTPPARSGRGIDGVPGALLEEDRRRLLPDPAGEPSGRSWICLPSWSRIRARGWDARSRAGRHPRRTPGRDRRHRRRPGSGVGPWRAEDAIRRSGSERVRRLPSPLAVVAMSAYDSLHEKVRRWIRQQGWDALHDVQERSIPILLAGERDLIVMAPTAGGKTEAAFLPIVSTLATNPAEAGHGFEAIYVSPMRALINDQFGRMESLCSELGIEVTKWHGDVAAGVKARARKKPGGIVLITPESLEALLVRRGGEVARLFRGLRYVVVDEMHVFLEDPRGKQLQSVLHRIDLAARCSPVRIGLSATLADGDAARAFIRPLDPGRVLVLPPGPGAPAIMLQLRGYICPAAMKPKRADDPEGQVPDAAAAALARHLFETHRARRSLIFAGSRQRVETTTVQLSEMAEAAGMPPVFFAHHGNLSREHREEAERRMKDRSRPASVVCTTTLELGIDVGDIEAVAQLGPGHTVSGMRQRIGRSGRRAGQDAVMRIYVTETELGDDTSPLDALRAETVQSIAMASLMVRKWNEPPTAGRLHLSTLLHQIMALIGQHGGVMPADAWATLVTGKVFQGVDIALFKRLLHRMADPEVALLEQASDGTLLPGSAGERLLESRTSFPSSCRRRSSRSSPKTGVPLDAFPAITRSPSASS